MTPVWARAVAELKLATRICIIGYSMPASDLFFKYLLTVALAQNHCLYKLIVVDLASKPLSSMVQSIPRKPCDLEERYSETPRSLVPRAMFHICDNSLEVIGWDKRSTIHTGAGRRGESQYRELIRPIVQASSKKAAGDNRPQVKGCLIPGSNIITTGSKTS